MSRREARETAMRLLYKRTVNKYEEIDDQSIELAKYIDEENGIELTQKDNEYIENILLGVETNRERLDKIITGQSKSWKLNRIPLVDLSVLRLALYEMIFREDIPVSVSINESVELAKKYCADSSAAFINGLLGQSSRNGFLEIVETDEAEEVIAEELDPIEIEAKVELEEEKKENDINS